MNHLLLVALGGSLGAVARYALVLAIPPSTSAIPIGTLTCNLLGCLGIGMLFGWLGRSGLPSGPLWTLLAVGVLGGFTTFSSFGLEVVTLLRDNRPWTALAYVATSNTVGIALAWAGILLVGGDLAPLRLRS